MFVWNVLQKDQWWSQLSGSSVCWGLHWARQMNWGLGTKAPVGAKATGMAVWTHDRVDWLRTVVVHPAQATLSRATGSCWWLVTVCPDLMPLPALPCPLDLLGINYLFIHRKSWFSSGSFKRHSSTKMSLFLPRSVCYLLSNLAALAMQE